VTDLLTIATRNIRGGLNESSDAMKPQEYEHYNDESLEGAETSDLQMLKAMTVTLSKAIQALESVQPSNITPGTNFYEEVERFEVALIQKALQQTGGNQAQAARLLGLNQTTLHGKIKHYGIYPNVLVYDSTAIRHQQEEAAQNNLGGHMAS
jgi:DNA-binding NtrC family response regulator